MNLHHVELAPDFALQTPRLRLTQAREGDGREVNAAILASWADLRVWMPWAKSLPSIAESQANSRDDVWKWEHRTEFNFTLRLRPHERIIGKCGLHTIDANVERAEIGYWLDSRFVGQGLMSEAVARLVEFADWLGFQRLEIRCDARNERSIAVARRLGFEREGCLRRVRFNNEGKLSDQEIWARLR